MIDCMMCEDNLDKIENHLMIDFEMNFLVFTLVKILRMQATTLSPNQVDFSREEKPQLPSAINILTILTFVGCGIGFILILFMPMLNKFFLGMMEKAASSGEDIPASKLAEMQEGRALIELTQANMMPIMAIGLIGIALCTWGAIWMRKLKKDGYWIYVGGEILPLIGNFILLGTAQFTGVVSIIMAVGIPLLFVALYSMQRKFLVN